MLGKRLNRVAPAVAAVAAAACGSALAGTLPVLSSSAVPGLSSSTHEVGARTLAGEATDSRQLARLLAAWRFSGGRERDFQGESKRIDLVVSRTLEFERAAGARAYVRFLGSHPAALFGAGSTARKLSSRGRSGYLITAASCACHRAVPTLVAVLAGGRHATWLEANGGAVTDAFVRRLVAVAP